MNRPTTKTTAHILLIVAFVGFIVCTFLPPQLYYFSPYIPILKAIFEASLVGGIADWFAVSALFRHPLGIPIPHTAIIPNQKKKIAKAFGKFLSENFLKPEVLQKRFLQISLTSRLKKFLSHDQNKEKIVSFLSDLNTVVDLNDIISNQKSAKYIQSLVVRLAISPVGDKVFESAIDKILEAIAKEEISIKSQISKKLPWFLPSFIDDKIYTWLVSSMGEWLQNWKQKASSKGVRSNPEFLHYLESDKFTNLVSQVLTSDVVVSSLRSITSSESWGRRVDKFTQTLTADSDFESKIEQVLQRTAISVANYIADPFSRYVSKTIEQWDNKQASDLLEDQFGDDLQYIRINGTILGGLIGGVLYLLNYASKSF